MLRSIPVNSRAHRMLVDAVKRLRENATSPEDIQLYDDILEGKRSARDLFDSKSFNELAGAGFARFQKESRLLNDDEARARAVAVEAEADRLLLPDDH